MKVTLCLLVLVLLVAADARRPNKGRKHGKRKEKDICGSDGAVYKNKCDFAKARKEACANDPPFTMVRCKKENDDMMKNMGGKKMGGKKLGGKKRMGGKKKKEMKICGSDGVTYDDRCALGVEIHCNKLKIVHMGSCEDCSKDNVCPWAGRKKKNLEKKREKVIEKFEEMLKKASDDDVSNKKSKKLEQIMEKMKSKREMFEKMLKQFGVKGKPVCGSNGVEYKNKCEFNVARCEQFNVDKTIIKLKRCMKTEA